MVDVFGDIHSVPEPWLHGHTHSWWCITSCKSTSLDKYYGTVDSNRPQPEALSHPTKNPQQQLLQHLKFYVKRCRDRALYIYLHQVSLVPTPLSKGCGHKTSSKHVILLPARIWWRPTTLWNSVWNFFKPISWVSITWWLNQLQHRKLLTTDHHRITVY